MAGLLDFLSGGPSSGGLLDFLRNNALNQTFPSGLPSDQAQYGAAPQNIAPSATQANAAMSPVPSQPPAIVSAQMPTPNPSSASNIPGLGGGFLTGYENFHHGGGLIGSLIAGMTGQRNDPQGIALQQQAQTSNLTARALMAKGIDQQTALAAVQPGNGDLLKQLISQSFGPQNVQNLGSGYIRDPRTGKITRAYTPDDKIPQGFAQDDNGTMHFVQGGPADPAYIAARKQSEETIPVGFQKTDKGLEPIPGGPADPNYLRMKAQQGNDPNATHVLGKGGEIYKNNPDGTITVVHKNEEGADASLSDDATKAMASQYLAGDRTVLQNLGRGAQGAANIVKLREEITKQAHDAGMSAKDIITTFNEQAGNLAGQRTVGTRAANISLAANEANNMIPIALAASEKVPRGNWMPWNKMVQAYQTGTSSPELASFVAATNSLVNAYVRAVSPSGVPTDSMREHAYSMLNSAQGPEAFKSVVATMQKEMQSALAAPEQVRKELRGEGKSNEGEKAPKITTIDGYKIMEH